MATPTKTTPKRKTEAATSEGTTAAKEGAEIASKTTPETAQSDAGKTQIESAPAGQDGAVPAGAEAAPANQNAGEVPIGEASDDREAAVVICHAQDGRRRGGRRFDFGKTVLGEDDLSDALIEALRGDPEFMVVLRPDLDPEA